MTVEVVFSHHGLAATTVVHAVVTLLTSVALIAVREGYAPTRWLPTLRVAHTVLGVLLLVYLLATYLVVPL